MKQQKHIRIAIAGGGTGGHLFPALHLGQAMEQAWGAELLFFGTQRGIEKTVIPQKGYPIVFLPVRGFRRQLTLKNVLFPYYLWRSLHIAKKALRQFQPDLVLGTGGYVMGPVLKSALKLHIPVVIQEQNSYPGVTTRLLAQKADYVFLAYEEAKQFLPPKTRSVVTGNPVRMPEKSIAKEAARKRFNLQPQKPVILVVGGSQGAENINRAVFHVLKTGKIPDSWQWLWQTGKLHFEKWEQRLADANIKNVSVLPFITEMFTAYEAAEVVVCRAGAMTLSELMVMGKPAVIIPYPHSAANHQMKNAAALAKKGAAMVVADNAYLPKNLQQSLEALLAAPDKIEVMSQKMRSLSPGNSVEKILELIASLLESKNERQRLP